MRPPGSSCHRSCGVRGEGWKNSTLFSLYTLALSLSPSGRSRPMCEKSRIGHRIALQTTGYQRCPLHFRTVGGTKSYKMNPWFLRFAPECANLENQGIFLLRIVITNSTDSAKCVIPAPLFNRDRASDDRQSPVSSPGGFAFHSGTRTKAHRDGARTRSRDDRATSRTHRKVPSRAFRRNASY